MLTAGKRKSIESVDKISQFASSVLSVGEGAGEEAAASEAASKTSSKKASLASKRKSKKKGSMAAPKGSMAARKSRKSLAAPGKSGIGKSGATVWEGDEEWDEETLLSSG